MSKREFLTLALTVTCAVVATSRAGDEESADRVPVEVFPLPPNMTFERHVVGGGDLTAGTASERLVYSNTLGAFAAALGAGNLVADDISINAPNGCKLLRLEFPVIGKVNPTGIGGPYSIDFALYSNCPGSVPSASRPALIIPGSAVHLDFPEDAPRLISFVVPEGTDVLLRTNFWFGVKFSRNNAGVVVGTPPLQGFSCDQFDFPGFPCSNDLGGFPDQPQASFNLQIYADAECPEAFVGYKNNRPSGSRYNPGANLTLADDIQLGVNGCQMIAYELAIKGVGAYTFDLRQNCDGDVVAGTQKLFLNPPSYGTNVRIVQFEFDPPITIPRDLWFGATVHNLSAGVVIAGQQGCIGSTENLIESVGDNGCNIVSPWDLGIGVHGAFSLTITCAGLPPVGACCDMILSQCVGGPDVGRPCCPANDDLPPFCYSNPAWPDVHPPCTPPGTCEAVCREVPQMNCPWPPRFSPYQPQWVEGVACSSDPFPISCGLAACCRPDDVCENLTVNQCNAIPPLDAPRQWQPGQYCGVGQEHCPWVACLSRVGDCLATHDAPGCGWADCCAGVCDFDAYCCLVEWDRVCVQDAENICSNATANDECSGTYQAGATLVEADSLTFFSNAAATESPHDAGFCCRSDAPGAKGFGTVWFKFTATDTSAKISTCNSDPAHDSLFQIFAAGDPSTEETACATLSMIACSDDVDDCGGGRHGKICVRNLTPGQTYYVMVAAKTSADKGVYQLDIRSPCLEPPFWNADDCNENGTPDGCEIARGAGTDCNVNGILDECEIASGTSLDCNGDLIPDECTGVQHTLRPDAPGQSFGAAIAIDGDWVLVGDPYGNGEPYPPPGAAYLFHREGLKWDKAVTLAPPEAGGSFFGDSVAMANGKAFVQDFEYNNTGEGVAGAVYVFARYGTEWRFQTRLVVDDPSEPGRALCQLSADGDRVAVSACAYSSIEEAPPSAVVYIFRRDGAGWHQEAKLTPPGPWASIGYGLATSLSKNRIAIGAAYESFDDSYEAGAVYVYRREDPGWVLESRLSAPDAYTHYNFGAALELRGDRMVVGVSGVSEMAFEFRRVGGTWILDGSLANRWRGSTADSVTFVNDGMTLVGAGGGSDGTTFAYVFQRLVTGDWSDVGTLQASRPFTNSGYCTLVRGTNDLAIVGVWNVERWDTQASASAHVFAIPGGDCNQNGVTDGCDLRDGTSADCNGNGVPDECDSLPPFDYDFDGDVDLIDLAGFQRCFTGPGPATVAPCCRMFDSEPDGDVDGGDFVGVSRAFAGP